MIKEILGRMVFCLFLIVLGIVALFVPDFVSGALGFGNHTKKHITEEKISIEMVTV